jgi:hypothetical protein
MTVALRFGFRDGRLPDAELALSSASQRQRS